MKHLLLFASAEALRIEIVDTTTKAWDGDKCTYNQRRLDDPNTNSTWNRFRNSTSEYTDSSFPPNSNMLYWKENLAGSVGGNGSDVIRGMRHRIVAFKRPSQIVNSPSLWGKKGVLPAGVRQGSLGDCWLLAALSALAEYPERIHAIFTGGFTPSGIMQLNFYERGMKKTFNMDDKLPVNSRGSLPLAKRSLNGAFWVPLLEKAMAKFNVNYVQLNGGNEYLAWR